MGDKNSYSTSFRGCQAISEIKSVGSSGNTLAPMPQQALPQCSSCAHTQHHANTLTLGLNEACGQNSPFPWQGKSHCDIVEIKICSEHISDTQTVKGRAGQWYSSQSSFGNMTLVPELQPLLECHQLLIVKAL